MIASNLPRIANCRQEFRWTRSAQRNPGQSRHNDPGSRFTRAGLQHASGGDLSDWLIAKGWKGNVDGSRLTEQEWGEVETRAKIAGLEFGVLLILQGRGSKVISGSTSEVSFLGKLLNPAGTRTAGQILTGSVFSAGYGVARTIGYAGGTFRTGGLRAGLVTGAVGGSFGGRSRTSRPLRDGP